MSTLGQLLSEKRRKGVGTCAEDPRDFSCAAVVDWFSRRVLAWRLSITLDTSFCLEALEEALLGNGKPEIFNPDQGSQFTLQVEAGNKGEDPG